MNDPVVQVVLEEIDSALAELPDAERHATAVRAGASHDDEGHGARRFPVTVEAEKLRGRIPPHDEITVTAIQTEIAAWDGRFEQLRR